MEEGNRGGNSDSDETVVESSVTESDTEEEEFLTRRWLPFLNKDMALTTETTINGGDQSPEIHFIPKFLDYTYSQKEEQVNPIPQVAYASDQSQSLLQGWINCPSLTESISNPGGSVNTGVEGQQNKSVDIKLSGFQKDSEEKISQKLSNEDVFPEISLCLDALLEDITMVPKEETPQDTFPHVLEDCQRTCMTIIDRDNRVKEHSLNNDTDLSLTSPGKIFMEAFTECHIETGELGISELLRSFSDSESLKMINPLPDKLDCQGHAFSIDPSADESSDALPVWPVTAPNALSGSIAQPITPAVPNETQLNTKGEQLNSEPGISQLDDDCTQITDIIEPQLATIQAEEIKALTESNLQRTTNEQPVGDQQTEKEVISDYQDATSGKKQAGEASSPPVEAAACAETAQTTPRKVMQLRETSTRNCRDHVSSHCQILEKTQQRKSQRGSTSRNKAKDLEKIQESTSKDKQDLETNTCQEITLNEDREAKLRRSKRIENKLRQVAFGRNYVNPACPILLSTINRRNRYGETLLHRAVAHQDLELTRSIIKAGGNVNAKDYAGWTALHTASLEGFYGIANELLKAGSDVNAKAHEQITPLQDAVKEGHYEMAELLLWYGADPLLQNEMGRCALEEASDPSMKKLLESYVANFRRYSVSGGDDSKNLLNTQSVEDTNLQQISLQTDESEPACADLTGSGSTDILQQTAVNEVQNIYANTSEEGTSCAEQTLQENAEALVAHEILAATNGEGVSGSPYHSTSGVTSTIEQKAPQPEKGGGIPLNAEEGVERCHIETENGSGLEIEPVALQLHEKNTLQTGQKREDLQETNSKADLHFGVNAGSKSSYSLQILENMQKEASQKTDGVFARVTGTGGTEKNSEEGNAKTNMLSQFTETEEVQMKRVRLDPQETSQKAASYSRSSKNKLSSHQSQFSQASEQQSAKKSGSSLSSRKEAVILRGTCNTRSGPKMKSKRKMKNAKGETRLHIAARRGDLSLVKTLISSGICVNEQDYAGWTAIHEASIRGFSEIILELLKAGADVNSRSLNGILPIHDAVFGNYLEAARILLQHGANPCERNSSGKSALDEACDDEMKELLKSYSSMDCVLPVETIEVTERRCPSRLRRSKCCDCSKNNDASLEAQHEKYDVESFAAMQDTKEKQEELLVFELKTSKDADIYIQRLSQMQDTLNDLLAKQKTERDTLAKKYRASVEAFKNGALREQLVNLASRQKSLLTVARNQEELVQKIQNYRRTKQALSASRSEKQISNLLASNGNDKRQSLTADEIMRPDAVTFSAGLGANMPNGHRLEAHLSLENRFSTQECSQHPHICLDETGASKEAIRSKEASDHALTSENRVREYPFNNMSKLTNAVERVILPSQLTVSTAKRSCSQQKDVDFVACVAIAEQGNKSLNPTSVTKALNPVEARSSDVNNNVWQPGSDCQQVLTDEDPHRYKNKKEAFQQQQQQVILSTSAKISPNTLQQIIVQSNENSFNVNSVLTNLTSDTDYPVNLSKESSQSCNNQEYEQKQVRYGRRNKKKLQLIDLLELGRIKPGENVLEFKLQEFSHKATLLNNGKIRTSKRQILQNPVQWVKDLLGSDIYVSWKYVWNKVTYLGTQLSKFLVEELSVSSDLELPSQEGEPLGKNFVMRDPRNHNQHHQSPGTVSIAQPLERFDLSNMQLKTPSLPQTEVVKTLFAESEAAVTRKFKCSSVQSNSVESLTHFLQFREIVMVCREEFLPCPVMEKHWSFYKGCKDFGF